MRRNPFGALREAVNREGEIRQINAVSIGTGNQSDDSGLAGTNTTSGGATQPWQSYGILGITPLGSAWILSGRKDVR